MAEAIRYVCGGCQKEVVAWSDGNPYYLDEAGRKQYAFHPHHEKLALCVGNDVPHLCLTCGEECVVDSRIPIEICQKCGSDKLVDAYLLAGQTCPYCKSDAFVIDPNYQCIS